MKILLVHNRYKQAGGEDVAFETEKNLLKANNHEVMPLVFNNADFEGVFNKIKLGIQLFYNTKSAYTLNKIVDSFKPDIIHVHNFFYNASPSILFAANKKRIPIIVTLHNYRLICSGSLLMRDFKPCELCVGKKFPTAGIKYSCHRNSKLETAHLTLVTGVHKLLDTWNTKVSRYIALTEFAKKKYINSSLNLDPNKVVVKANSVNAVEPSGFHEREKHFLFIGRLSQEKGIETLLAAFSGSQFSLEIIGDGPLRESVKQATSKNQNINYLGHKDNAFIISKLKKCNALIVPSIWYEGLPTTILEAFSTGTPVITSNIGNLNEIVSHGHNGLQFNPNSPEDLVKTIKDFSENRTQYKALYENARKTYIEKYSPEINYTNLVNIYTETIREYSSEKAEVLKSGL